MHRKLNLAGLGLLLSMGAGAEQSPADAAVDTLAHRWAAVTYQTPVAEQDKAYQALITQAKELAAANPHRAEPLVWEAIALSSDAKVVGGLSALGKAKAARDLLVAAEAIDASTMQGSIYASLGSLYAKVPGWPVGFGDKKQARAYFEKALAIDATSIDSNYFYADFLNAQGESSRALQLLERALAAPLRPGREDADVGRRAEVTALLAEVKKQQASGVAVR